MKKWHKTALTFGIASSLLVPSFASAAETGKVQALKEKAEQDLQKKLKLSDKEQKKLAYKKQQEQKELLSANTIIVKYEKRLDQRIHKKAGTVLERSIPALGYDVVKLAKGQNLNDVLSYYSKVNGVISAAQSVTYKTFAASNDPKKKEMYHLSLLNMDKALSLAGKHSVTVAVIDTGMDVKHPDLDAQILPPYNVLDPAKQPFTDVHGTHVAGIIASEKGNGIGGHGVNPNAKILPVDVFNGQWGTSDYAIAEGILYAISKKADVINMSLGGSMESPILEEAVKKAIDAGITIVAAAGNDYGESISYPAAYEGVISVGATNDQNKLAQFSSYGAYVDVVAPGEAIYNTVFDYLKGSSFTELSGTSMASPVVAGIVSLLKSKNPNLKPHEIDAILKMSAKDLGAAGYDTKYGFGLVDPVKALQFDLSKLPKKADTSEDAAFKNAKAVTEEEQEIKGQLKSPGEVHWLKVELEEGEGVQAILDATKEYNYEMLFRFYPTDEEKATDKVDVNKAKNGEVEASFYQAKEAGTLVIGVKDAYGNYHIGGNSNYTLKLSKEKEVWIDDLTADAPMDVKAFPFHSEELEKLTFAVEADAEEADKDYFRFTVEEPTTLKFNLSAVPGINSSIAVYFEEDFHMERPKDWPADYPFEPPYVDYVNNGGTSEGEQLMMDAVPGMTYLLEVSAKPKYDFYYDFLFGYSQEMDSSIPSSSIPYTFKAEQLELPEDEDGLPVMMDKTEEEYMEGEMTKEEYKAKKKEFFQQAMDSLAEREWRYYEEEMVKQVVEHALPYEIGSDLSGQFQFSGDEDFYKFTSHSDAIYQFELGKTTSLMPWVTIFEYDKENNDLFPVADISSYWYYGQPDLSRSIALEEGKEYFIRFINERYQANDEKYTLASKKLMDIPVDNDLDAGKEIKAKILKPGQSDTNHLIYGTDVDFYYYSHTGKDAALGLTVKPQPLTNAEKAKLPEDLHNPLVPFLTVVEDTNRNMQIDEEEYGKAMAYNPSFTSSVFDLYSSFKAKKDVGYFLVVNGFPANGDLSIEPYEISLHALNGKDEDASSVVKNNVPSKPIALKKGKTGFEATGHLNAGIDFGDKDFYQLKLTKNSKLELLLEAPAVIDGIITIYDKNGKKLGRYDNYGAGDSEVANAVLKKGSYYIVVEDAKGASSTDPYHLSITLQ